MPHDTCRVDDELRQLMRPDCMETHDSTINQTAASSPYYIRAPDGTRQLPAVYIMHAPFLRRRRALLESALAAAQTATRVVWMLCANREDVERLSAASRSCLLQRMPPAALRRLPTLPARNGTDSLALKHLLAYHDMRERRVGAALIIEE